MGADAHPSAVGEPYGMKVGAASKGIIQRDFQHHATVFKSPYAKNPFDSISNEELEEYKRIIDKKNRGESEVTSPVGNDDTFAEDTTDPDLDSLNMSSALERSLSTRGPPRTSQFDRNSSRSKSLGRPGAKGDHYNGEETDGNRTFSEGEGDTSRATDTEMASPRKEKKKKSGLRTPSFLKKKKKDKKKEKEKA